MARISKKTKQKVNEKQSGIVGKSEEQGVRFFEAVGRRKTAIARVRIWESKSSDFLVNEKPIEQYFPQKEYFQIASEVLSNGIQIPVFSVEARVHGGGIHAQAEAIRHGLARSILEFNGELRTQLKVLGFLTRDPRMRERKKFGLRRARRARQWRKR